MVSFKAIFGLQLIEATYKLQNSMKLMEKNLNSAMQSISGSTQLSSLVTKLSQMDTNQLLQQVKNKEQVSKLLQKSVEASQKINNSYQQYIKEQQKLFDTTKVWAAPFPSPKGIEFPKPPKVVEPPNYGVLNPPPPPAPISRPVGSAYPQSSMADMSQYTQAQLSGVYTGQPLTKLPQAPATLTPMPTPPPPPNTLASLTPPPALVSRYGDPLEIQGRFREYRAKKGLDVDYSKVKQPKIPKSSDSKALKGAFDSLGMMAAKSFGIISVVAAVGSLISAMFPFQMLFDSLTEIFGIYGALIGESFTPIIEAMFATMLSPEVMALVGQLSLAFSTLFAALMPIGNAILPIGVILLNILIPVFNLLAGTFEAFMPIINAVIPILEILLGIVGVAMIAALEILNPMIGALAPVFDLISAALVLLDPYLTPLVTFVSGLATALGTLFGYTISGLITFISDMATAIAGFITGGDGGIAGFINTLATTIVNFVGKIAGLDAKAAMLGIVNGMIKAINAPIDWINTTFGTKISKIPEVALAAGGLISGPTLALVGDNPNAKSDPEVVAPLSKLNSMGGIGGGVTINVYGDMTESKKNELLREMWLRGIS